MTIHSGQGAGAALSVEWSTPCRTTPTAGSLKALAEILEAYEANKLTSVGTKAELSRLKEAARATAIKDRRVTGRLAEHEPSSTARAAKAKGTGRRARRGEA